MFGRPTLRELLSEMREESRLRHAESKRRDEEFKRGEVERGEEFKRLIAESERRTEETREFNREILLRNEKVYTSVIAQLEKNTAKVHESTEETRAQTRALMTLIDRMEGSGGAAAA